MTKYTADTLTALAKAPGATPRGSTRQVRPGDDDRDPLLVRLGSLLRDAREDEVMLSVAEVARRSGLSARFIHDLEAGRANVSVVRLASLARECGVNLRYLFENAEEPPQKTMIALIGLRGAGKSSVGAQLAKKLLGSFFELDRELEREAGTSLATLFGERREQDVHDLEARALARLTENRHAVIAVGGSIVERPRSFALLKSLATTIWLKARPEDHWNRVRKQGDLRPMRGRPDALAELDAMWKRRKRLYERADKTVDTSRASVEETVQEIVSWLRRTE